jgi:hypothetical protein
MINLNKYSVNFWAPGSEVFEALGALNKACTTSGCTTEET